MYKIIFLTILVLGDALPDCSTNKDKIIYKASQDKLKDILPGIARQYLHNHVVDVESGNWSGIIVIMKFDNDGYAIPSVENMATTGGQIDINVNRTATNEIYSSSHGELTFHMEERHNSQVFIILTRTNIDNIVNVTVTFYNDDRIICQKIMV